MRLRNVKRNLVAMSVVLLLTNAANVARMRQDLQLREDVNVIAYGCSAYLLNLLAKDLEISNIKEQVVNVVK